MIDLHATLPEQPAVKPPVILETPEQITGALKLRRARHCPKPPTIRTALHDLFMMTMAFYCEHRELRMAPAMLSTLRFVRDAVHAQKAQWLMLSLGVQVIERCEASADANVRAALDQARQVLASEPRTVIHRSPRRERESLGY